MQFQGPQSFFPSIFFVLLRGTKQLPPNKAAFRVPSNLQKYDIQQYLEKLYDVTVTDVKTFNFIGRRHRRGIKMVKESDWKKAIVTMKENFERPAVEPLE